MSNKVLKVHPGDNVIVALQDIAKGESISYDNSSYKIADDIPAKHKFFEKDMNAGEIAEHFNMSKPSISHHLDLLRQADVVQSVKEGQFITYSLNTTVFDEMVKWIMDVSDKKNKSKK